MVEQHRRVEPRYIVGTGMATDPERIDRIKHDVDRRERDTRQQPVEGFGDVLGRAPPRGELADEPSAGPASVSSTASLSSTSGASPVRRAPARTTLRAPDPRARQLHAQLNKGAKVADILPSNTTHADEPRADASPLPASSAPRT